MSKYIEAFDKVEPSEEKKQEFLYKTQQHKNGLQANNAVKAEDKPRKPFNWNIRKFIIAASTAAIMVFCVIFISIMTNRMTITTKIVIIDASASMMAEQDNGKTRFENSVGKARALGEKAIANKEEVIVILAGKEAETIVSTKSLRELNDTLNNLECAYGQADIDGATTLANAILSKNKKAEAVLYTAKQYETSGIEVIDVFESEWNVAILDIANPFDEYSQISCFAYYKFQVTVASYNKETDLTIYFEAKGVNDELKTINAQKTVFCKSNESVVFDFDGLEIYEYDSVHVYIDANDSLESDNEFYLYDGRKETIRMLYVCSVPNAFFNGSLMALQNIMNNKWNIEITQGKLGEIELKGYDFYIIENSEFPGQGYIQMPEKLPTDGLVWLINPNVAPQGSGLVLGETINLPEDKALSAGQPSPIMNGIIPEKIAVKKYRKFTKYDGYEVLMYCGDDPALMVKNTADAKLVVMSFDLHYSSLAGTPDFPILIYNLFNGMFDYFLPSTITEYVFEVDEEVSVNARGQILQINNEHGFTKTYTQFPNIAVPPVPGSYTLTQTLISGRVATDKFYAKISTEQSDFSRI